MGTDPTPRGVIRVGVIDDEALVRSGLRMLLNYEPDIDVIAEAADGDQLTTMLHEHPDLDIVLLDIRMPRTDGMSALRSLSLNEHPCRPRVLMLTTFESECHATVALADGASGFLLKDATSAELTTAIRAAHEGNAVLSTETTTRLLHQLRHQPSRTNHSLLTELLTDREQEVVRAIATGATNTQIAQQLHISENTVKTHVGRILTKLGLHDRVHLVITAYRSGLID